MALIKCFYVGVDETQTKRNDSHVDETQTKGNGSHVAISNVSDCEEAENVSIPDLNCTKYFYFDTSTGLCRPMCGWSIYKETSSEVRLVVGIIATVIIFLFSSLILLSAVIIQKNLL